MALIPDWKAYCAAHENQKAVEQQHVKGHTTSASAKTSLSTKSFFKHHLYLGVDHGLEVGGIVVYAGEYLEAVDEGE